MLACTAIGSCAPLGTSKKFTFCSEGFVMRLSLTCGSSVFFFLSQALQEVQQQTKQSKADTLGLRERIQDLQQDTELTPC